MNYTFPYFGLHFYFWYNLTSKCIRYEIGNFPPISHASLEIIFK